MNRITFTLESGIIDRRREYLKKLQRVDVEMINADYQTQETNFEGNEQVIKEAFVIIAEREVEESIKGTKMARLRDMGEREKILLSM